MLFAGRAFALLHLSGAPAASRPLPAKGKGTFTSVKE